jgi:hypothetical protein
MGTVSVYCLIGAQDREDAVHEVNGRLSNHLRREFYDGFEIQQGPGDTQPLDDIPDDCFTKLYAASQSLLQQFREEAEKARRAGDRGGEAVALRRASDLLFENMCAAMPWYNLSSLDFSLPSDKRGWWAVMVDFYY